MLQTKKTVVKDGINYEETWLTRIMLATPIANIPDWKVGVKYNVVVNVLFNKRVCIYKDTSHYFEPSGYRVYDSLEELQNDFKTEESTKMISSVEKGKAVKQFDPNTYVKR